MLHGFEADGSVFPEFIVSEVFDRGRKLRRPLCCTGFRQISYARNDTSFNIDGQNRDG